MGAEILNQDEIDALLKGVDDGAVPTTTEPEDPGKAREYDLATQVRIVRGRMPTLEMINDRFARFCRSVRGHFLFRPCQGGASALSGQPDSGL